MMDHPDNPFWDFSLALYARPGVTDACLRLQDRLGLDVNLLLYACWTAASGVGRPSPETWRRLVAETAVWRSRVVEPLRAVRRYLKEPAAEPWRAARLRERVKALELDAERAEQLAIVALAGDHEEPPADAVSAMLEYVDAFGVMPSDADRSDLILIASQIGADMGKM